jgi:hypothetical protein
MLPPPLLLLLLPVLLAPAAAVRLQAVYNTSQISTVELPSASDLLL